MTSRARSWQRRDAGAGACPTRVRRKRRARNRSIRNPAAAGPARRGFFLPPALRGFALSILAIAPALGAPITPPGTSILNQAAVDFVGVSGAPRTELSNEVEIVTVVSRTPAVLGLLRVVPGSTTAHPLGPSECAGSNGFTPLADPVLIGAQPIDATAPHPVLPSALYHIGEPVFVQVTDADQNLDPALRETVEVLIESTGSGDQERIRITETAPDSGVFAGYVPTGPLPASAADCVLQLVLDDELLARYQDPQDPGDRAEGSAQVDPLNVVFDAHTGARIDGASVTLVDAATGQPAQTFGDDGVSRYPATVPSGGTISDAGGTTYSFAPGGFRFPVVPPGNYRFVIGPPDGYAATTTADAATLQGLPGAPYSLGAGSFGSAFGVDPGPSFDLDIPLDPLAGELFIRKVTPISVASPGDFVTYALTVENRHPSASLNGVAIDDRLPRGLRYVAGSARADGSAAIEPQISADGQQLRFALGTLAPGEALTLRYVVEITIAARAGSVTNLAVASDGTGLVSNEASATIELRDELFRDTAFIMGRVLEGDCAEPAQRDGVAGIRIYLEDGRYVLTDEEGRYHFDGVRAGGHVVQLDVESLAETLELAPCEADGRSAGRAHSRFVDLPIGGLWRADFHLRRKAPPRGEFGLSLSSELHDDAVHYALELSANTVPVHELEAIVLLPAGLSYIEGSAAFDGTPLAEPRISGPSLAFALPERGGDWSGALTFEARWGEAASGALSARALARFTTPAQEPQRTPAVENVLLREPGEEERVQYVLTPRFAPLEAELHEDDRRELDRLAGEWHDARAIRLIAVGHTDSMPIAARSRHRFADNYALSYARADAVARYLQQALGLGEAQIIIDGRGADEPLADEATPEGRHRNRRVELTLTGERVVSVSRVALTRAHSERVSVPIVGRLETAEGGMRSVPATVADSVPGTPLLDPEQLRPGIEWLAPVESFNPPIPSLKVAVKHAPGEQVTLAVNGAAVSPLNFDGTAVDRAETVAVSRWRGVDLVAGANVLSATVRDADGATRADLTRVVHFSGGPVRGALADEHSTLLADGRTRPVIALRVFDRRGQPAREATVGSFRVDPPYRSQWEVDALKENQLVALGSREPIYQVGPDGIAYIELEPTTVTGEVVLHLVFPEHDEQEIRAWLEPAPRDWILVGFAEGTLGYNTIDRNRVAAEAAGLEDELYEDGRVAFFSKGRIKGDFLLTLAYDSAGERSDAETSLHGTIDPDTYYPLYGDTTEQRFEAASQRRIYVKLERRQFFALFGDYDTGLTVTELSRYSRSFNGLKSEYHGRHFRYSAFAAESSQAFVKDEMPGDGTSGLYRLSRRPIIANSEKVTIEVRDRFRSELIVESRNLARHLDYSIDYLNGTLFFKQPVPSRDLRFNPVYIVVDYESRNGDDAATIAGGRTALGTADGRLEAGFSAIHEGTRGAGGDLYGADLRYEITELTELKAELAHSDAETAAGAAEGSAYLVEVLHRGEQLDGRAYLREQEVGFGLGQQRATETGTRKAGLDGRLRFARALELGGELFRQDNLETDSSRDVGQVEIGYQNGDRSAAVGLRTARDEDATGRRLESNQAFVNGSVQLLEDRVTLRGASDFSLDGAGENIDYPDRSVLGLDYRLTPDYAVFSEYEVTSGAALDTRTTRLGVKATPWNRAQLQSAVNHQASEYGPRTFATLGLVQAVQLGERWMADFGLEESRTVSGSGAAAFDADVPLASGSLGGDFLATFLGAVYRGEQWTFNSRLEHRNSDFEDRWTMFGGFYREQRQGHGFSAGLQAFSSETAGLQTLNTDLRLGWAWRPDDSDWMVLDRLDLIYESNDSTLANIHNWRIVNNLNANWQVDARTQMAVQYGAKYVRSTLDGAAYSGYTDLTGLSLRRDIDERWDVGLHTRALHSWRTDVVEYGVGVEVGRTWLSNLWVSLGYNLSGFDDADFSAGGYTAAGPYLRVRIKADQHTLRDIGALFGGR